MIPQQRAQAILAQAMRMIQGVYAEQRAPDRVDIDISRPGFVHENINMSLGGGESIFIMITRKSVQADALPEDTL